MYLFLTQQFARPQSPCRAASLLLYISVNSVTFILEDFNIYLQLAFQFVINPKRISPMTLYSLNFVEFRNLVYLHIWKIYICNYRNFEVPTGDSVIYLLSYVSQLTQFILTLTDYLLFINIFFIFVLFCVCHGYEGLRAMSLWRYVRLIICKSYNAVFNCICSYIKNSPTKSRFRSIIL